MKLIPKKYSPTWVWIFIIHFIVVYGFFMLAKIILHSAMTTELLITFAGIAVLSALIGSVGGFLGSRIFFSIYACGSLIAVLYMLYIVVFNTSPGWEDLTSIVSYIFVTVVGAIAGITAQLVAFVFKLLEKRRK